MRRFNSSRGHHWLQCPLLWHDSSWTWCFTLFFTGQLRDDFGIIVGWQQSCYHERFGNRHIITLQRCFYTRGPGCRLVNWLHYLLHQSAFGRCTYSLWKKPESTESGLYWVSLYSTPPRHAQFIRVVAGWYITISYSMIDNHTDMIEQFWNA